MRSRFVSFSVALTGYDDAELWGTGMVKPYLGFLVEAVGDEIVGLLLSTWARIADAIPEDRELLERLIRSDILENDTLGPIARNLIVMWYLGEWQQLPANWRDVHGAHAGDQTCFVSPDAYTEGLVWRAIGAHPQGAKMPGYGSWALPPKLPEELP